jgi:hypothetical protein
MNLRTLGGPLLAFASAAVMLGVIAGLAAYLISSDSLQGNDDFIIGEYGFNGSPQIETQPLADSYPFTPYFRLPEGSKEVRVTTNTPSGDWFGEFVLPKPSRASLDELRKQVETSGLSTASIRESDGGFTFNGPQVGGSIVLFQFSRDSHVLVITLTRFQ